DRLDTNRDVGGNRAPLVDEECHRGREDPVPLRQLPPVLHDRWEAEAVLHRLLPVFVDVSATDEHNRRIARVTLLVQPREFRREYVTRAAVRVREHHQHAAPAIVLQRDLAASADLGEAEGRRRRSGLEAVPHYLALRERFRANGSSYPFR